MRKEFLYDVFLSHSAKDNPVVRSLAERLQKDGLKVWFDEWAIGPGDRIPEKIEEGLENSRVLVLCISVQMFGSDWAQLESSTFRFRDPLNKERRFLPLRLDEAPMKDPLAQFPCINWFSSERDHEYAKLLSMCSGNQAQRQHSSANFATFPIKDIAKLEFKGQFLDFAFSRNAKRIFTSGTDGYLRIWNSETGACLRTVGYSKNTPHHILLFPDESRLLVGGADGNARVVDLNTETIVTDFGKSEVSRRQMDCFRLLGSGFRGADAERILNIHHLTFSQHIWELRKRLGLASNQAVREYAASYYEAVSRMDSNPSSRWHQRAGALSWISEFKRVYSDDLGTDGLLRLCQDVESKVEPSYWNMAWSADRQIIVRGFRTGLIYVWKGMTNLVILEGHTDRVNKVAMHPNERFVLSGADDGSVQLWDLEKELCIASIKESKVPIVSVAWNQRDNHALFARSDGAVRMVDFSIVIHEATQKNVPKLSAFTQDQVQYTNAKVLLVGDTNAGKTGLTHRLATNKWKPSGDSTVGAWSTQWQLKNFSAERGVDREIWLWDFGGQADQRLIHQLYMDRTALILLLFNADQEDVLPGLRDWQTALRRCVDEKIPCLLVAGRIDTGFKASRGKLHAYAREQGFAYYETSAKSGEGCDELRATMISCIPWSHMEKRTSPRIFKLIKDEILKLRDEGEVLHTFKELRDLLLRRLPDEPRFTDETVQTVIGLLDGPGVVKELNYGTYILLAPEWINAYAQAVIRTLRSVENDLGVLPLRSIAEGKLVYQSIGRDGAPIEMKRLPTAEERVVLGEMERQLEQRGLCLRQGDKLVFPSHCGRDRPAFQRHQPVSVSYAVKGFLDDIYATLVVKLADSESFKMTELWRDAADFVTLTGDHHMGIKLTRETASAGDINVYFGKGVTQQEQVIFANYIHGHLGETCEQAVRLRHYVCPKCHTPKGNAQVLMEKLIAKKEKADVECDKCETRFPLWDTLEKKFAREDLRKQVEELQAYDLAKLTSRRKGKLLVLDVGARITSANQKWHEVPGDEDDGIDIMLEFTNEEGNGTGKGLCLQLKAGNSHLSKRKTDGAEIFTIKKQRWLKTWINQPYPVMLVIGTFSQDDEQAAATEKVEFAEVRWMEISSLLKQQSKGGKKPIKQIQFKGERMDLRSVRRWREKVMADAL